MGKDKSDTRQKRADTVHNQLLMGAIDRRKAKKGFIKRGVRGLTDRLLYVLYCSTNIAKRCKAMRGWPHWHALFEPEFCFARQLIR